jgi:hypothetical protein
MNHKKAGALFAAGLRWASAARKAAPPLRLVSVGPNGSVHIANGPKTTSRFQSRAPAGVTPPRAAAQWKPRDGSPDPWVRNGALDEIERNYRTAMRAKMTPTQFADAMEKRIVMLRELRASDATNLRAEAKRRAQRLARDDARINETLAANKAARIARGRR